MEEIKVNGIVIESVDYKENDKLLSLFTVELGKITVRIRGVKSPKSKLRSCAQLFAFGEWELMKSKEYFTVKTVSLVDSFYDITYNYSKYIVALSILEICNNVLRPNMMAESLFIALIKCLQILSYEDINERYVFIKFNLMLLQMSGYALNFEYCDICGMKYMGPLRFDTHYHHITCKNCSNGVDLSQLDMANLRIITNTDIDKLGTIKIEPSTLTNIINVLILNIENILSTKLKSLSKK